MDHLEIGWIAGIIEGEGCFTSMNNNTGVRIVVCMTDFDVIEKLEYITKVGTVTSKAVPENRKQAYCWKVNKYKDVARILLAIYPLMSQRRQARINEMADILISHKTRHLQCPNCGVDFTTKHIRKLYCNQICKNRATAKISNNKISLARKK